MKGTYTADFETANSDYNIENNITWVWLWDICDMKNYSHVHGNTIETFMAKLSEIAPATLYFHNAKFDTSFILDYLLKHGYEWTESRELNVRQFKTLISDTGAFYSMKICIPTKRSKSGRIIEIRDSAKKIAGSVEKIAIAYDLPILKGEIDYKAYREEGYVATPEELKYIEHDTEIIARVLKIQYENLMTKLTSASDTFNMYKENVGKSFEKIFPVLTIEEDDYIRASYRGGVVQANPKYTNKKLYNVHVYDVNSMYPAQMSFALLPYGKPKFFTGKYKYDKLYPLHIQRIEVCMRVKDGFQPTILHKGLLFLSHQYLSDTEGQLVELTLTDIDMQLMYRHYNIFEIHYLDGMMFRGSRGLFCDFLKPIYEKKCNSKGAEKQLQKIYLNSLYGKFAMSPRHINKMPYLNNDEDNIQYHTTPVTLEKPVYTAVASFITAYARKCLFDSIQANYAKWVYCDTDSVHVIDKDFIGDVDEKLLGAFKLEKVYHHAIYMGQKAYIGYKEIEGSDVGVYPAYKKDLKLAGCPDNCKDMIDEFNFKVGTMVHGKLLPKVVNGGTLLVDTDFTIKDRSKTK